MDDNIRFLKELTRALVFFAPYSGIYKCLHVPLLTIREWRWVEKTGKSNINRIAWQNDHTGTKRRTRKKRFIYSIRNRIPKFANQGSCMKFEHHFEPETGWMTPLTVSAFWGTVPRLFSVQPHALVWDAMHWRRAGFLRYATGDEKIGQLLDFSQEIFYNGK